MYETKVRKGEPVERALKRIKSFMDQDNVMEELRSKKTFETPRQKAKRKLKASHRQEKFRRAQRRRDQND
jgi:small subunit ribosomal protein S21